MAKSPKKTAETPTENPNKNKEAEKDNQTRQPRQVMVHAQYVKDLSFENPNAVSAHLEKTETPQVEIGVQVNGDKINDHQYEVRLHITAKANTGDKPLFLVDLTYAGIVSAPEAGVAFGMSILNAETSNLAGSSTAKDVEHTEISLMLAF